MKAVKTPKSPREKARKLFLEAHNKENINFDKYVKRFEKYIHTYHQKLNEKFDNNLERNKKSLKKSEEYFNKYFDERFGNLFYKYFDEQSKKTRENFDKYLDEFFDDHIENSKADIYKHFYEYLNKYMEKDIKKFKDDTYNYIMHINNNNHYIKIDIDNYIDNYFDNCIDDYYFSSVTLDFIEYKKEFNKYIAQDLKFCKENFKIYLRGKQLEASEKNRKEHTKIAIAIFFISPILYSLISPASRFNGLHMWGTYSAVTVVVYSLLYLHLKVKRKRVKSAVD